MTGPIRAQLKLRNNRLMKLREQLGLKPKEMAEAIGVSYAGYLSYEALSPARAALNRQGEWRPTARLIADYHGVSPEYLWPEVVRQLKQTTAERELSESEAAMLMAGVEAEPILLPDEILSELEEKQLLDKALYGLGPREQLILRMKYDQHKTLREIGDVVGLSSERVRQLQRRALNKLRQSLE